MLKIQILNYPKSAPFKMIRVFTVDPNEILMHSSQFDGTWDLFKMERVLAIIPLKNMFLKSENMIQGIV